MEEILISAIEHYSYCPRQCGLIYLESIFEENVFTLRGEQAHKHVSEPGTSWEGDVRLERALPVWSERFGLYGVADIVEFHPDGRVVPVEYKHGPRRRSRHVDCQLCAYALCLEEMLGVSVPTGAVFSARARRRREVAFSAQVREDTLALVEQIRAMLASGQTPPPVDDERCPTCSLVEVCIPSAITAARQAPDLFALPEEDEWHSNS